MKKITSLFLLTVFVALNAQESANRFFYELTFKPKKDSAKIEKVMTVLDITKNKSVYKDFTFISQDSIMKVQIEAMQKSGVFKDISKSMKTPKFGYKVFKTYPTMKMTFTERIQSGFTPVEIGYSEDIKFNWNITNTKEKIGEYNTQKATTDFGGRKWTAWFTSDIALQDGPYKFHGLPGLIVKIEDADKNYSWELKGNKKVENYIEPSYVEQITPGGVPKLTEVSKEKFEKTMADFRKDPMATVRPQLTTEMLSQKMPGSDISIGDMIKQQEKILKDFYESNNNDIEIKSVETSAKKKK